MSIYCILLWDYLDSSFFQDNAERTRFFFLRTKLASYSNTIKSEMKVKRDQSTTQQPKA